jgi:hypothetical protein
VPPPVAPPAATPAALIAAPAATTVATTISVASSLSSVDISAPILPRAARAAAGLVNASSNKAPGFCNNSTCAATAAVITTAFPFSSVLTSTGVAAGRSLYSIPDALISAELTASPGFKSSIRVATTASFCSSVNSLPALASSIALSRASFSASFASASAFNLSASACLASASALAFASS